jgi:hypothetical protein
MLGVIGKPILILTLLIALLIGGLRSGAYTDDLYGLIVPHCTTPCWQGIEIGVTTREEATRILETHPWVAQVFHTRLAVTWRWNGSQPAIFNSAKDGLLQIGGNVVRQLRIQTLIPFGEVWLVLGRPDDARLVRPFTRYSAYQIVGYDLGIQVISSMSCPVEPKILWMAPITLGMGDIWTTEALNTRQFDMYRASNWWDRLRSC